MLFKDEAVNVLVTVQLTADQLCMFTLPRFRTATVSVFQLPMTSIYVTD